MSFTLQLIDGNEDTIQFDEPWEAIGAVSVVGGATTMELNFTFNYSAILRGAFRSAEGIRSLYGKSGVEVIPILQRAIRALHGEHSADHWEATEGNVKRVLRTMLVMSEAAPWGVWVGD